MQFTSTPLQKPQQDETQSRGLMQNLKDGIQAQGWIKPSDFQIPNNLSTVYDPDFNYKKSAHYEDFKKIQDKDIASSIILEADNDDQFGSRVKRALATEQARRDAPWYWQLAGGVLSPEMLIPATGVASRMGKASDLIKLASMSRKERALLALKGAGETAAATGAVASLRQMSDDTYTSKDAAIDTLLAGALGGALEVGSLASKARKGALLKKDIEETTGLFNKIKQAQDARVKAQDDIARAESGLKLADDKINKVKSTKPDLASNAVTPHYSMSRTELKSFLSGRMKRTEYRALVAQAARLDGSELKAATTRMDAKADADIAISRLRTLPTEARQKLEAHLNALQAEYILFKRSEGMVDGIERVPVLDHNAITTAMGKAVDFTGTRLAMEQETAHQTVQRLYKDYIAKWEGVKEDYSRMHSIASEQYQSLGRELDGLKAKVDSLSRESTRNSDQISFKNAAKGLGQGKVTPLLNWTVGLLNEHKRAMRSPNASFRKLATLILNDAVEGGKSAASTKQALMEMMVRKYDKSISKPLKALAKEKNVSVPEAATHVTDLVEGLKLASSDLERELMAKTSAAFRDALDLLKTYNPSMVSITHSDSYVPHLVSTANVRKMFNEASEPAYIKAMADGIKRQQGRALVDELLEKGLTRSEAESTASALIAKAAEGYIERIKRLADIGVSEDAAALRQTEMALNGEFLPDIDLNDLAASDTSIGRLVTQDGKKSGVPERFKTRLNFSMAGEAAGVRISDLFERDSTVLVGRYQHEMSAWAGLADVGLHTPQDVERLLNDIRAERDGRTNRQVANDMRKAHDYMMLLKGVPLHPDTAMNDTIKSLMAVQFMTRLGMSFVPAIFEYGRPLAMMTTEAARRLPVVSDIARWLHRQASTEEAKEFASDLQAIMQHKHRVSSVMRHMLNPNEDALSHRLAQYARTGADVWGRVNLMEPVDRLWRAASIDAFHARVIAHVMDGKSMASGINLKYVGYNRLEEMQLRELIKKTAYKENGTWRVDFDKWSTKQKYDYAVAMDRAGNRFIQKGYLGDNAFERASPLTRMLLQFRGFTLTGLGKQFTADIAAAEREGLTGYAKLAYMWLFMAMTTQLGLEARARIQYAGDKDYDAKVAQYVGGENAVANMIYNHPALGGMRTLMDMAVGGAFTYVGKQDVYDEAMGQVQRSSGLTNVGAPSSVPAGSMVLKDIPGAIQEPDARHIATLLPSNFLTRIATNMLSQ